MVAQQIDGTSWRLGSTHMPVTWELLDNTRPATAIIEAMRDVHFKPGTSVLFDARQASDNPSSAELIQRAEWLASLQRKGLLSRYAVVIGNAKHQAVRAGMASLHSDSQGIGLEIFTDIDEARRWLESTRTPDRE